MNSPRATVSRLLPFSCVDGPGNRLVLFLQGCNFCCPTCHNPHTQMICDHCGECVPACHAGALALRDGRIRFTPSLCDTCDDCLRACPKNSNPMLQEMSLEALLDILRDHFAFLDGITVSGGEPTTQLKFVTALFRAIKQDGALKRLSCMIDSNGHLPEQAWHRVLPWCDGVMLDIKAFDPDLHLRLTGQGNARVLQSARLLQAEGKLQEIRYLVIPGFTDRATEISALARLLQELGPDTGLRLNAFRRHGVHGLAETWPETTRAQIEAIAGTLAEAGIENVTCPVVYA